MLVDVSVGGFIPRVNGNANLVNVAVSWLSCCQSSLEVLTLKIREEQVEKVRDPDIALPQFTKLKQLTFSMYAPCDDLSLIAFTSMIRASPTWRSLSSRWLGINLSWFLH
ncbi:OLC1v1011360C2 [Oldenlandia corymbosa var. corymbosa]|uniref:OLC1v1011360C2 n=1 Tax=Oldenlandia corymbosa var. corymbosa TaxID=529605 RepID=A0AAV1DVU6_OLDCO|nr:OLC1v1011360C2 [Oldenlandia corymbosa var. corymbosa]